MPRMYFWRMTKFFKGDYSLINTINLDLFFFLHLLDSLVKAIKIITTDVHLISNRNMNE